MRSRPRGAARQTRCSTQCWSQSCWLLHAVPPARRPDAMQYAVLVSVLLTHRLCKEDHRGLAGFFRSHARSAVHTQSLAGFFTAVPPARRQRTQCAARQHPQTLLASVEDSTRRLRPPDAPCMRCATQCAREAPQGTQSAARQHPLTQTLLASVEESSTSLAGFFRSHAS